MWTVGQHFASTFQLSMVNFWFFAANIPENGVFGNFDFESTPSARMMR
jgi:hypothetical protein